MQIDAALVIKQVIKFKNESRTVDYSEIIMNNHRDFIFNMNVNQYFRLGESTYNQAEIRFF